MSAINYTGPVENNGDPVSFDSVATITRVEHFTRGSLHPINWLYSVSIDGATSVAIGTSLKVARSWAKKRAALIVETWRADDKRETDTTIETELGEYDRE